MTVSRLSERNTLRGEVTQKKPYANGKISLAEEIFVFSTRADDRWVRCSPRSSVELAKKSCFDKFYSFVALSSDKSSLSIGEFMPLKSQTTDRRSTMWQNIQIANDIWDSAMAVFFLCALIDSAKYWFYHLCKVGAAVAVKSSQSEFQFWHRP